MQADLDVTTRPIQGRRRRRAQEQRSEVAVPRATPASAPSPPFGLQWWPARVQELPQVPPVHLLPRPAPEPLARIVELPFSPQAAAGYGALRLRRLGAMFADAGLNQYEIWCEDLAGWIEHDFSIPPPGMGALA